MPPKTILSYIRKIFNKPSPNSPPQKNENKKENKTYSSDANIDEFVNDICKFFTNTPVVYIDVGAYIGEVFSKLLDTQKINIESACLIEPNPQSFEKLKNTVDQSSFPMADIFNVAISSSPETALFKANQSMTKRVNGIPEETGNDKEYFTARCERLDNILNSLNIHHINLLKIDVEGEELDVLQSIEPLLTKQAIDVIYIEVGFNKLGTQQTYAFSIDSALQDLGYRVYKIYEQKNEWPTKSPLLRRCNFAYMSNNFAKKHTPYR